MWWRLPRAQWLKQKGDGIKVEVIRSNRAGNKQTPLYAPDWLRHFARPVSGKYYAVHPRVRS